MKKIITGLLTAMLLSMPATSVLARGGDAAAGVAAGLIGGAMITGIASQSGRRRAREAREEAREARREAESVRREQQQGKISDIQRRLEREHLMRQSSKTFNLLIFAIILLFLGVIGLAVVVFKKK